MPAPEPKGTIDSLALLTQRFGRRAGDMKVMTEFSLLHACYVSACVHAKIQVILRNL